MNLLGAYRALARVGGPVLRFWLRRRARRGKEDGSRLGERFGIASAARPPGPLAWLHAASVGESLSLLPLIRTLRRNEPGLTLLVTSGTRTSATVLQDRLPAGVIHQYNPADHPEWVARFLDTWRPNLALYVESELWPSMISLTQARGIPTGLLNARMSSKSFRNWRRLPGLIRPLMSEFRFCLAQNATQAARMKALGAQDPKPLGNLKFTATPTPPDPATLRAFQTALGTRPRWLAASTHPGEEIAAAEVHTALASRHPGLITLLAPRHPGRAREVAEILEGRGLSVARRSLDEPITPETDVYLLDTLGELSLLYSLARIAFVGGSLRPHGGHNPIEPAQLGCAILHGPDMHNFSEVVADLEASGGDERVPDTAALVQAVDRLLSDPASCEERGRRARLVAERQRDLLDAVLRELDPVLAPLRTPVAAE